MFCKSLVDLKLNVRKFRINLDSLIFANYVCPKYLSRQFIRYTTTIRENISCNNISSSAHTCHFYWICKELPNKKKATKH